LCKKILNLIEIFNGKYFAIVMIKKNKTGKAFLLKNLNFQSNVEKFTDRNILDVEV